MSKSKIAIILWLVCLMLSLNSCKTKEYIEVPVEVEKVKIEYVHKLDSVYLHDSISTYIIQRGDTVFIDRYKFKVREVYRTDTIHRIDSIPQIVTVNKVTEVNKLYSWQKTLMWIGGVGIVGLLMFLIGKLGIWKLLF